MTDQKTTGMTVTTHIMDAGGLFGRRRPLIERTAADAIAYVVRRSRLAKVDLVIQPSDFGANHLPVDAFTSSGSNVHVMLERSSLSSDELEDDLYRAIVHELHHALRWRHVPRWTVGEAVVLEGLAVLADRAAAGPSDTMDRPMRDPWGAMDYIRLHRAAPITQHRRWLYSSEPEQPGAAMRVYTAGRHVMRAALREMHITPWTAARRGADELLDAGLARLSGLDRAA